MDRFLYREFNLFVYTSLSSHYITFILRFVILLCVGRKKYAGPKCRKICQLNSPQHSNSYETPIQLVDVRRIQLQSNYQFNSHKI